MDTPLAGRKALVTGAGMGIGQAIAIELARQGADVAIHYAHSAAGAEDTCAQISQLGRQTRAFQADLGKIDERGYVHIVGRGKDLVITGGYNVYPKEIEVEIDALPGVFESAVFGVPHADFGEGVTAVVVRKKGADLDEQAVLKALDSRLAKYKQPKRVLFIDELPRNTMGKVQKNLLRDAYNDLYDRPRKG